MASPVNSNPISSYRTVSSGNRPVLKPSSKNPQDNDGTGPVNKKIVLIALAAGLIGTVVVGFKTGLVCAVIAGGLAYRSHHPEAFKVAEAQITKWVSDVKAYFKKAVKQTGKIIDEALPKPKSRLDRVIEKASEKVNKAHRFLDGITMAVSSEITSLTS